MGIEARAEILCRSVDEVRAASMRKEVLMLTAADQMGHRFKAMAVVGEPRAQPPTPVTLFEN